MPMNMIQIQPGLCLTEFLQQCSTEAKWWAALYRWRWLSGFGCTGCGGQRRSSFRRGRLSASDNADQRNPACFDQTATEDMVACDLPVDVDQDQPRRAGVHSPPGRLLSHCLADEAQDHACQGGAPQSGQASFWARFSACADLLLPHRRRFKALQRLLPGRDGSERRRNRDRHDSGHASVPVPIFCACPDLL